MRERRVPPAPRTIALARDPYQLERALGVVLWVGFFLVLLTLG